MNQENNQLYNQFEKEVWLFLDGDLPDDRMLFWNEKLKELPELNKIIDEYKMVSDYYDNMKEVDLSLDKYNSTIDQVINKSSLKTKFKNYFLNVFSPESEFAFGKIAFASALIVAAVAISFLSNKPIKVVNITESINTELLDWDAEFVDDQISKMGNLLRVSRDEEYRKYYMYNQSTQNIDKNLNLINSNIKTLKEEINNKKL